MSLPLFNLLTSLPEHLSHLLSIPPHLTFFIIQSILPNILTPLLLSIFYAIVPGWRPIPPRAGNGASSSRAGGSNSNLPNGSAVQQQQQQSATGGVSPDAIKSYRQRVAIHRSWAHALIVTLHLSSFLLPHLAPFNSPIPLPDRSTRNASNGGTGGGGPVGVTSGNWGNWYELLGVWEGTRKEEVRREWKRGGGARWAHPDKLPNGGTEWEVQRWQEMQEALDIMEDDAKRFGWERFGPEYAKRVGSRKSSSGVAIPITRREWLVSGLKYNLLNFYAGSAIYLVINTFMGGNKVSNGLNWWRQTLFVFLLALELHTILSPTIFSAEFLRHSSGKTPIFISRLVPFVFYPLRHVKLPYQRVAFLRDLWVVINCSLTQFSGLPLFGFRDDVPGVNGYPTEEQCISSAMMELNRLNQLGRVLELETERLAGQDVAPLLPNRRSVSPSSTSSATSSSRHTVTKEEEDQVWENLKEVTLDAICDHKLKTSSSVWTEAVRRRKASTPSSRRGTSVEQRLNGDVPGLQPSLPINPGPGTRMSHPPIIDGAGSSGPFLPNPAGPSRIWDAASSSVSASALGPTSFSPRIGPESLSSSRDGSRETSPLIEDDARSRLRAASPTITSSMGFHSRAPAPLQKRDSLSGLPSPSPESSDDEAGMR